MVLQALAARYAVEVAVPESAEALARAARQAAESGAAAVLVAGGDGTVRLAAEALADRPCALGILPAGTANDGARALGLPRDLRAAAARLTHAHARAIDLVGAGDGAFYTVGGLGVVTAAARRAARLRAGGRAARAAAGLTGAGVYRLAAALALLAPDTRARRYAVSYVTAAGARRDETVDAHGAFLANLRYCGGGLAIPGTGPPDDGVFELCFIAPAARPRLAARFARLAAGIPVPAAALRIVPVREVHVVCDAPDALLGDGDQLTTGRVFHLRARPRALRVLA